MQITQKHPKAVAGVSLAASVLSGLALVLSGNTVEGVGVITAAFSTGFAAWSR